MQPRQRGKITNLSGVVSSSEPTSLRNDLEQETAPIEQIRHQSKEKNAASTTGTNTDIDKRIFEDATDTCLPWLSWSRVETICIRMCIWCRMATCSSSPAETLFFSTGIPVQLWETTPPFLATPGITLQLAHRCCCPSHGRLDSAKQRFWFVEAPLQEARLVHQRPQAVGEWRRQLRMLRGPWRICLCVATWGTWSLSQTEMFWSSMELKTVLKDGEWPATLHCNRAITQPTIQQQGSHCTQGQPFPECITPLQICCQMVESFWPEATPTNSTLSVAPSLLSCASGGLFTTLPGRQVSLTLLHVVILLHLIISHNRPFIQGHSPRVYVYLNFSCAALTIWDPQLLELREALATGRFLTVSFTVGTRQGQWRRT